MNFPTNICPCSQQINMSLQNLLYVLEFLTEGVYWTWWEGTHPLAPFCWEASDWAVFGPPVGILCTTGSSRNNWAILSVRSHPPLSPHSCASVFSLDICFKKKNTFKYSCTRPIRNTCSTMSYSKISIKIKIFISIVKEKL